MDAKRTPGTTLRAGASSGANGLMSVWPRPTRCGMRIDTESVRCKCVRSPSRASRMGAVGNPTAHDGPPHRVRRKFMLRAHLFIGVALIGEATVATVAQ